MKLGGGISLCSLFFYFSFKEFKNPTRHTGTSLEMQKGIYL